MVNDFFLDAIGWMMAFGIGAFILVPPVLLLYCYMRQLRTEPLVLNGLFLSSGILLGLFGAFYLFRGKDEAGLVCVFFLILMTVIGMVQCRGFWWLAGYIFAGAAAFGDLQTGLALAIVYGFLYVFPYCLFHKARRKAR